MHERNSSNQPTDKNGIMKLVNSKHEVTFGIQSNNYQLCLELVADGYLMLDTNAANYHNGDLYRTFKTTGKEYNG